MGLQIAGEVLKGGIGLFFTYLTARTGWSFINGVEECLEENDPTTQKVQEVFLKGVMFVGLLAGTISWVGICGWVDLGGMLPVLHLIGLGSCFITSVFGLIEESFKLNSAIKDEGTVYYGWKVSVQTVRVISKVSLVVASVFGAIAIVVANPLFSLAALVSVCIWGFLHGVALQLDKEIASWGPPVRPV